MKPVRVFFAWYDFWIGFYFDTHGGFLYICPLPMCVIRIKLSTKFMNWLQQEASDE